MYSLSSCKVLNLFRGLLTSSELSRLQPVLEREDGIGKYSYGVDDGHGRSSRMCLWNHPGNDITGELHCIVIYVAT